MVLQPFSRTLMALGKLLYLPYMIPGEYGIRLLLIIPLQSPCTPPSTGRNREGAVALPCYGKNSLQNTVTINGTGLKHLILPGEHKSNFEDNYFLL